ncbi:GNAT family N-acetyltransferase [Litoribacillus peritrichatus]|uniref:GNAT family N-acetyltransferase n=1 Tax=Litoribacillus peritrichatus TaxID=718191 RepID=A0ABP7ND29_9GAMM
MLLRPIETKDNPAIEGVIRTVLTEFGANKPGFAWQDPELSRLSTVYQSQACCYLVVEHMGKVVGGGGIAPFVCDRPKVCELQKMYLLPETRGLGFGQVLMTELMSKASSFGYQCCYLETIAEMKGANALYQKNGFKRIDQRLGNSGHSACDVLYLKEL